MSEILAGSFAKKLNATYLSYLPAERVSFPLNMHVDVRGSFTEVLKTGPCGQFSVNIMSPGQVKAEHLLFPMDTRSVIPVIPVHFGRDLDMIFQSHSAVVLR